MFTQAAFEYTFIVHAIMSSTENSFRLILTAMCRAVNGRSFDRFGVLFRRKRNRTIRYFSSV
jgi:hypothetical protein